MVSQGRSTNRRPSVAVLCRRWGEGREDLWALRLIAGALAVVADVTVFAAQGSEPRRLDDGVFEVVELGTDTVGSEEDRLLDGWLYLAGRAPREFADIASSRTEGVRSVLGRLGAGDWRSIESEGPDGAPDLVLVADFTQHGATRFARAHWPGVPIVVVPLVATETVTAAPAFAATFHGTSLALVFSEDERVAVEAATGVSVRVLPLPMAQNPSVLRGPHEQVGPGDYLAVFTDSALRDTAPAAELARFLVGRFPDWKIALGALDQLVVFERGRTWSAEPTRGSDLLRLMAWSRWTIDLRPGPLVARRCLESLLHGTPIVVPGSSRGREHAQRGQCGLWFDGPAELAAVIEAASGDVRGELAGQGADYVRHRCRPTEDFVAEVVGAVGSVATRLARAGSRRHPDDPAPN